jgi:starvation-inducible DNA-binding protein
MKPNVGIKEKDREAVVDLLNKLLSDEFMLYTKTRKFHWNVTGPRFHDLHKFFESLYEELDHIIDDVAERARSLGGHAFGTFAEYLKSARLKENPGKNPNEDGMLKELLSDHEAIIKILREDLVKVSETHGDAGTNDFLTGLMEKHEKTAWFIRAFIQE